ncbi:MAG TPA: hydrogenase/urease maturation nickel metallochaperone HypA [Candidatus Limnocylindrales bacterium]
MHEVGMVAELLDAAVVHAAGEPVSLVRIRFASTVPEDVLRQAFEMLAADGPLGSAALEAEPFDVRLACPCGFDAALEHDDVIGPGQAVCPSCGELRGFPPTPELELVEVRLAT